MAIGRIGSRDSATVLESYKFTASGGETSLSGADSGGRTLNYPINYEVVFLNGVRLVRGDDYTATTGTSITGLSALTAGDVVEILVFQAVDVADAISQGYADGTYVANALVGANNGVASLDSAGQVPGTQLGAAVVKSLLTNKADIIVRDASAPARLGVGTNGQRLEAASGETTGLKWASDPVALAVAVSDETTAITTGNAKVTFRMPFAMTVTAVRASLSAASTSGTPTFDINEGGSSILGTKLSIDANEKTSTTAASAATITDSALADDAEITIDIDTAGTGAKGAKVYIIGTRA